MAPHPRPPPLAERPAQAAVAPVGGDDPKAPAPFVPDEADAPRDPDTGEISIDEPDVGDPPPDDPEPEPAAG